MPCGSFFPGRGVISPGSNVTVVEGESRGSWTSRSVHKTLRDSIDLVKSRYYWGSGPLDTSSGRKFHVDRNST